MLSTSGGLVAVIAVDFDHTLIAENAFGEVTPMPGAREAMEKLRADGHRIIIHTCRIGIAADRGFLRQEVRFIEDVLDDFQIPYDEIWLGPKMVADYYVDDRAVSFEGDWNNVLDSIASRRSMKKSS